MMFEVTNMAFALPEMFMLAMACVILLVVAFMGKTSAGPAYMLSQLTLVVTMILIYQSMSNSAGLTFDGTYIKDAFSDILKLAICALNIVVLFQ